MPTRVDLTWTWVARHARRVGEAFLVDGSAHAAVAGAPRLLLDSPSTRIAFRHAVGSFWSTHDPANVRGVADILGHASFGTTEKHYIMAQSRLAGRALQQAIERARKRI